MYPDIMLEAKIGEMLTIKCYFYIFEYYYSPPCST